MNTPLNLFSSPQIHRAERLANEFRAEWDEAIKSLVATAGINPNELNNANLLEAKKEMLDRGHQIITYTPELEPLTKWFILAFRKEFVTAIRVKLDVGTEEITRVLVPHDSEIEEVASKLLKHV